MYQFRPLFVQMSKTDDGSDRVLIADIDPEHGMPVDGLTIAYDYRYNTSRHVALDFLGRLGIRVYGYVVNEDHYILYITDFSLNLNNLEA